MTYDTLVEWIAATFAHAGIEEHHYFAKRTSSTRYRIDGKYFPGFTRFTITAWTGQFERTESLQISYYHEVGSSVLQIVQN